MIDPAQRVERGDAAGGFPCGSSAAPRLARVLLAPRPMRHRVPSSLVLFFVSSLAACSAGSDPAPAPPATTVAPPAPGPVPPEVDPPTAPEPPPPASFTPSFPYVENRGGSTIAKPHVVPIVFKGDPLTSDIGAFTQKLAGSAYWTSVATEYGVGALTASDVVVLDETPPASTKSSEIETWLNGKLSDPAGVLGEPDPSTLYAVFYPSGVSITLDGGGPLGQSCQGYGGYHAEINARGTTPVGYAVLPRCADIDDLTVATSHELFEWATDPLPYTKPAFSKLDDAHWAWEATMFGELSDLCTFMDRDNLRPTELGFLVQRHWSNKASLAGTYPCVPQKTEGYVQAIANATDDALVPDFYDQNKVVKTKAIRVAPGQSKTVDVMLYADRAIKEQVPLQVLTYDQLYGSGQPSGFTLKVGAQRVAVGGSTTLTVTAPKDVTYDIAILTAYVDANNVHMWPVVVTNDDASNVAAGRPTVTPDTMPRIRRESSRARRLRRFSTR